MSDDLTKRLRDSAWADIDDALMVKASDRIEALERELAEAQRGADEAQALAGKMNGACDQLELELSKAQARADRLATMLRKLCDAAIDAADAWEGTVAGEDSVVTEFSDAIEEADKEIR